MSANFAYGAAFYYAIGLSWLLIGAAPGGWLRWEGHLLAVALWMAVNAAIWPLLLLKILTNLLRGNETTDLY